MNRGVVVLVVMALAMIVAGCEQIGGARQETQLVVAREPIVTDIPVPEGFKMDLQRSFYYAPTAGSPRVGKLTYTGRAQTPELITFFRENMPVSGWAMKNEAGTFGSYVLYFEKGTETAQVSVTPYRFNTDVTVQLGRISKE